MELARLLDVYAVRVMSPVGSTAVTGLQMVRRRQLPSALLRDQVVGTLYRMIERVVVVGAAGSGKTTLARALGKALGTSVTGKTTIPTVYAVTSLAPSGPPPSNSRD